MNASRPSSPLPRFFAGVSEYIFQTQLGVADPPVVDYVSDLLLRFVRLETVHKVRSLNGRPMGQVAEMLSEAEERVGDARREVHRHIGDYTLFWAGVYPEALRRMREGASKDQFIDYCAQGKRAYLIASSIKSSCNKDAPSDVLQRLSDQFEICAYGLREMRREWERRDEDGTDQAILIR